MPISMVSTPRPCGETEFARDRAFGYERTEQNATEPLLLMVLNDLLLAHVASFL